jgi:hypothetical protein
VAPAPAPAIPGAAGPADTFAGDVAALCRLAAQDAVAVGCRLASESAIETQRGPESSIETK